jgi:hypothetical protein
MGLDRNDARYTPNKQRKDMPQRARAEIRELATGPLHWDKGFNNVQLPLHNLGAVIDLHTLRELADNLQSDSSLGITFVSQEYLAVGVRWIEALNRLGLRNYLIIAGDSLTHKVLKDLGVVSIEARINIDDVSPEYRSPVGFTAKGLAMNALKFPVVRTLLNRGYDIVMSDADALWLQNPLRHFPPTVDIAFQRVVYFPKAIVAEWGFAACSGFVCCRAKPGVVSFLDDCIQEHRKVQSDQLALNLALLEADTHWPSHHVNGRPYGQSHLQQEDLRLLFETTARDSIVGSADRYGLAVLALPHHEFWRHSFVRCSQSEMVICHPNSPKDDKEKIKVLGAQHFSVNQ